MNEIAKRFATTATGKFSGLAPLAVTFAPLAEPGKSNVGIRIGEQGVRLRFDACPSREPFQFA
jgi:hypothetical protein